MTAVTCLTFAVVTSIAFTTSLVNVHVDATNQHLFNVERFDDVIATYMRERRITGASVAVGRDGKFLIRKGYGRASTNRLMTPWALMRVGSVSKVITAVAVMKLVEQGTFSLQSTVFGPAGLLTEFSPTALNGDRRILDITVLHLLQHTSGWDHRLTGDPLFTADLQPVTSRQQRDAASRKSDVITHMMNETLQYKPGTRYSYSNFGYTVLGLVVDRFSNGIGYEQFVRDMLTGIGIFRMKLGATKIKDVDMSEVEYFTRDNPSLNAIAKDDDDDHDVSRSPYSDWFDAALLDSTSGWISSSSDLVRLFEALSAAASVGVSASPSLLLTPSSVRSMLDRPSYDRPAPGTAAEDIAKVWYGLGLVVEDGGRTFWHSGTMDGSTSVVARDGDVGLSWAALLNCRLEPTNDLWDFMRYAVRQVFAVRQAASPPPPQPSLSSYPPLSSTSSSSSSSSSGSAADSSWLQQHDSSVSDENEALRPEPRPDNSKQDSDAALRQLVDSVSSDGRTAVKLMLPSYRVSERVSTVAAVGYRLTWIDAVNYHGRVFFNVIWTKNEDQLRWRAYFDLTPVRYRKRFRARVVQGFRLSHVETYVSRRRMRYAAIFVRDSWPDWTTYEGLTPLRHRSEFYRHLRDGYRLVVQAVTEYKGQLYVAAIYDRINLGDSRVRLGLSSDEFGAELRRQLDAGRVLAFTQAYEQRADVRFSAVWTPRTSRHWAAGHAMSKYALLNRLLEYGAANVPLACVTAYVDNGASEALMFAALWR